MYSANRRLERRDDIVAHFTTHYHVRSIKSYAHHETHSLIVEGTGSMILDRTSKKIYACLSQRSDLSLLEDIASDLGYSLVPFTATDDRGVKYYHTNVIMSLAENVAIICLESITDITERDMVRGQLEQSDRTIIDISRSQVAHFCGNMLQLKTKNGEKIMVMSDRAYKNLTQSQIDLIKQSCTIIHSPLPTIEKYGGGSARCMIGEIFLFKK